MSTHDVTICVLCRRIPLLRKLIVPTLTDSRTPPANYSVHPTCNTIRSVWVAEGPTVADEVRDGRLMHREERRDGPKSVNTPIQLTYPIIGATPCPHE